MELILLDNVEKLGEIGDVVNVSEGYARNFLIPQSLAAKATKGILRKIEMKKIKLQKQYEESVNVAKTLAEKLTSISVTVTANANEEDKLFGSVTARMITDALKATEEIDIDHNKLALEPIHKLGVYNVDVFLHPQVTATLKVWVVNKES
ncbi:MAG: 50S ribosomal protein L9 [Verrucomicrobiota bacterium]|nr:50S ribosomal protein L9 [Verrucomicrobiota bacterium]